jgi:hypothetical protein
VEPTTTLPHILLRHFQATDGADFDPTRGKIEKNLNIFENGG